MKNFKFSIITVTLNSEKFLKRCLDSVKHQTYKNFFQNAVSLFQKIVKSEKKIIDNERYIIYLSSGIVYYYIEKFKLTNVGMKEIVNIFHIKNKFILEYYEIIKSLKI